MVKPKGVWLQTTELSEIQAAKVVKSTSPSQAVKLPTHAEARPKKRLLVCSLAVCCLVLLVVVSLHMYPGLFAVPAQNTPGVSAANGEQPQPNLLEPSYGVLIQADGNEYITVCRNQTVAEALHQVGVVVGAQDEVSLPLDSLIEADTIIGVSRLYSRMETETEEIAPARDRVEDATLAFGETKVLEEGVPGLRENTLNISYRDGKEIDRTVVASRVLKEPGLTTVAYGVSLASRSGESSGQAEALSVNGESINYSRKLAVESTAYTWTGNKTATGTWPDKGTIAVDPRVIPLGSKVYVEGYGFATATDTGGAIKGNIIDVYFPSYDECIQWGRKHGINVYILE